MPGSRPDNLEHFVPSRRQLWLCVGALMLLPVLVIRGTSGEKWDLPGDLMFLIMLLAGVAVAYELAVRVPSQQAYKAALALAVCTALFNIWINLAVGIIGSEDDPVNLLYAGVIAVACTGIVLARLRPGGMAIAMLATALAQLLVFVVALAAGFGFTGPITVFFTALWLFSAALFQKAEVRKLR